MAAKDIIEKSSRWNIGNGKRVHIWDDRWILNPDSFKVVSTCGLHPRLEMISSLLDMERRDQDATKVRNIFLPHEAKVILGIPINPRLLDDSLSWAQTSNDRFTMKSTCRVGQKCLKEGNNQTERGCSSDNMGMKAIWKLIWNLNGPNKIKHYMWSSYKNIMPTKLCLKSRGIRQEDGYDLCGLSESSRHFLWGCSLVVVVQSGTKIKLPFLLKPPREFLDIVWEVKENPLGIDWNLFTITAWSL